MIKHLYLILLSIKDVIMRNHIVFDYLRKKVKMFWHGNFTNKCTLENNIIIIHLQDIFTFKGLRNFFIVFFYKSPMLTKGSFI